MTGLLKAIEVIGNIFAPFVYGLVMAYLLCPIYNLSMRKLTKIKWPEYRGRNISEKISNILAVTISIVILLGIITALLWAVVPSIMDSIIALGKTIPESSRDFIMWLQDRFQEMPQIAGPFSHWVTKASDEMAKWIQATLAPGYKEILSGVSDSIFGALNVIKNLLIGLIICVLFLSNKNTFSGQSKKLVFAVMNEENADNFLRGASFVNKTFGGFINGKIIDSVIIGCICFVFMSLVGWPYASLISVIIGITNIIPFFGPFIGAIPSALLVLTVDSMTCLYFLLFILVLQQIDGNIIGPKILGGTTGLPTFWVMFAILIGGGLFGFIGMIIGIPVFAVIYAYTSYKINSKLEAKNLTTDLEEYKKLYVRLDDGKKSPWAKPAKNIEKQ